MDGLVLRCVFLAHSYQGVRQGPSRDEELDWPPSPARIHQALISAALRGLRMTKDALIESVTLQALRWLEEQSPPEIVASAIYGVAHSSTHFRVAIPQNNPAKGDMTKTSVLLKPVPPLRAVARGEPLRVDYVWPLEEPAAREAAERHFSDLEDLVAQVRYLGRGEDQIEARLLRGDSRADDLPGARETWRPSGGSADAVLWVARRRSTDELLDNYAKPVPERTRKPPATRFLREQGYTREASAGLLPIHVAIFQLFADSDPDEPPFSCDAENAGIWRGAIRQKAVEFACDRERWDNHDLARELVTGHPPGQLGRSEQPHLAFVPLPSISAHGKADGRVRRFALLGYSREGAEAEAAEVYRVLSGSLDGESVEAGTSHYRLQLRDERPQTDKVWSQFVRSARLWHSVTPVALGRGFKVPILAPDGSRTLTSNERHLRRLAEWTALLRASLRHICLPGELAAACSITLTASPLVPHTERAERYRPPGESAVFTHARIEFPVPVRGPLLVGDRRYFGYGLFFPDCG